MRASQEQVTPPGVLLPEIRGFCGPGFPAGLGVPSLVQGVVLSKGWLESSS